MENDLSRAQSYEKLDLDTVGRKNLNSGLDAMPPLPFANFRPRSATELVKKPVLRARHSAVTVVIAGEFI
jgi:hypothetical protein